MKAEGLIMRLSHVGFCIGAFAWLSAGCTDDANKTPPADMSGGAADAAFGPGPGAGWFGTLDVEIRDSVAVRMDDKSSDNIDVALQFQSGGYQPFGPAVTFQASGRIEHIPEAATDLYVAHYSLPALAAGPCGARPMSVALSLARREKNDRVGGSLSIYCGDKVWWGVPARILRLTGKLPAKK